jgi:hypothetical protein
MNATLYFHYPCFDGLVSAVLAWVYLEHCEGWRIERFCPVKYDVCESWLATNLDTLTAVVDFLYHPQVCFWADHHLTTFITQNDREDFERRKTHDPLRCEAKASRKLFFDGRASSCARLLWENIGSHIPDASRYEEMMSWADKIDSASYSTVHEAILGDAPALRISRSLALPNGSDYPWMLLTELRTGDLSRVAALAAVSDKFNEVRRRTIAGLHRVKNHVKLYHGEIAIFNVRAKEDEIVSRYIPYYRFADARYSIGIVRTGSCIKITAMRNPWRDFTSIPLGEIFGEVFKEFGGGGHQRVAAVSIPTRKWRLVRQIIDRLLFEARSQTRIESVTA